MAIRDNIKNEQVILEEQKSSDSSNIQTEQPAEEKTTEE